MKENQKTTVTIEKEQQSFEVENGEKKSTMTISAEGINIKNAVVGLQLCCRKE